MRTATHHLFVLALLAGPCSALAHADGGQVRRMERRGDYQLTVFTSPSPLRAGPIDVSVLVQDARTGQTVPDAIVTVELTPPEKSLPPIRAAATTADATNKLLRAALVDLPASGSWDIRVECTIAHEPAPIAVAFTVEAAPPLPRWLSVWPWFTWPLVAAPLLAIHRMLVARRQVHLARGGTPRAPSEGRRVAGVEVRPSPQHAG
jgi:hypothetical protein